MWKINGRSKAEAILSINHLLRVRYHRIFNFRIPEQNYSKAKALLVDNINANFYCMSNAIKIMIRQACNYSRMNALSRLTQIEPTVFSLYFLYNYTILYTEYNCVIKALTYITCWCPGFWLPHKPDEADCQSVNPSWLDKVRWQKGHEANELIWLQQQLNCERLATS